MNELQKNFLERVANVVREAIDIGLPKTIVDAQVSYLMAESSFFQTLLEDPDFVFHYHSKYWAKNILTEQGMVKCAESIKFE
uniref:Uncharacterized protein n=1 Tax=Bacillus phage KoopaTroopa TaxID=3234046 RepID=A0AB39C7K1_9CAUD